MNYWVVTSWIFTSMAVGVAVYFYFKNRKLGNQQREYQAELVRFQQQASLDDQKKSKFIASAAHDLRQPLHALALFSDALLNRPLESGVQDIASKIKQSVTALVELFNTLFDVSKLETGSKEFKVSEFSIRQILKVLDDEYKPQIDAKGLSWHCDLIDYQVLSDAALLETVLRNLVSNAMRYTPQGGIRVSCQRNNGQIYISVSDTGVGIAPQQQQEIFQEFHQLGNSSRATTTGLGLGLSIVDRLIKLLGHDIQVKSEIGRGTTFTLIVKEGTTPVRQPQQGELEPQSELAGLIVLVIDDDPAVRDSMRALLESWHCDVIHAGTEKEVHSLLTESKFLPNVIISDYQLAHKINGLQLLESILPLADLQVPVLFISGSTTNTVVDAIKDSGYLFLPKPVQPAQLRAFLRNVARNSVKKIENKSASVASKSLLHFPLQSLLNRFINEYQIQAEEKGILFSHECNSVSVFSNPEILESIFRNMLNFVFKRTQQGTISLQCNNVGDDTHISIVDGGKSISTETLQILEESHSSPTILEKSNLNLELSLAFQLAYSLGHYVHVTNKNPSGAVFTLQISNAVN